MVHPLPPPAKLLEKCQGNTFPVDEQILKKRSPTLSKLFDKNNLKISYCLHRQY